MWWYKVRREKDWSGLEVREEWVQKINFQKNILSNERQIIKNFIGSKNIKYDIEPYLILSTR